MVRIAFPKIVTTEQRLEISERMSLGHLGEGLSKETALAKAFMWERPGLSED